jgi:hypothetical protein
MARGVNTTLKLFVDEFLKYDPDTGILTWKKSPANRVKTGDEAGTINANGYKVFSIRNKLYSAHRIAWLISKGALPLEHIDHINGIRSDNKLDNMRAASNRENLRNCKLHKLNKSGVTGVKWYPKQMSWESYITVDYKKICLGYFKVFFDAVAARKSAEIGYGFHVNHGNNTNIKGISA